MLINKPRQKTSKYTVWVVHKCFSFDKAQHVFPPVHPRVYNHDAGQTADRHARCFVKKTGSARRNRPRPTERRKECVTPPLKTELERTDKLTHARARAHTFTTTYIHTYTRTKYMASNVESRQLNKWHFLLCFFFS